MSKNPSKIAKKLLKIELLLRNPPKSFQMSKNSSKMIPNPSKIPSKSFKNDLNSLKILQESSKILKNDPKIPENPQRIEKSFQMSKNLSKMIPISSKIPQKFF